MDRGLGVVLVLVCALATRNAVAEVPKLVGDLGGSQQLLFVGQKTFTEQELRDGVGSNLELNVAGHPHAELGSFLKTLRKNVHDGYLHAGFPHARVDVEYDETRSAVVVTIDEGSRYSSGDIEIDGAVMIPKERISDYLTSRRPKRSRQYDSEKRLAPEPPYTTEISRSENSKPLWHVGQPASFSASYLRSTEKSLREQFRELGYFDPVFSLQIRPEENGTAALVLTIGEEGPQSFLGEIHISGNKKNSREDIIHLLELVDGMPLNSNLTTEMIQKLRASARFLKQSVQVCPPFVAGGKSTLKVVVCENDGAPPLVEEFSPLEQAAVRVAKWFDGLSHSNEDVLIEYQWTPKSEGDADAGSAAKSWAYFVRTVISPARREGLVTFRVMQLPDVVMFEGTLNVRRNRLVFDSGNSKIRCELATSNNYFIAQAMITTNPPTKKGETRRFMVGCGMGTTYSGGKSALQTVCDPAAVIGGTTNLVDRLSFDGPELIYVDGDAKCRFDAQSGRLIDVSGTWNVEGAAEIKVQIADGLYDQELGRREQAATDRELFHLDESPFAAIVAFFENSLKLSSIDRSSLQPSQLMEVATRWRELERLNPFLEPLEDRPEENSSNPAFFIPYATESLSGLGQLFQTVLPLVSQITPEHSWAWTISREFAFIVMGQAPYHQAVVGSLLQSEQTGPLAHLLGAYAFGFFSPQLRTEFARRGLEKLDVHDFQQDYLPFLRADTLSGKLLSRLGPLLQDCREQEIEQLVGLLPLEPGNERDAVMRALSHFPQHPEHQSEHVLSMALDELWEPLLKSPVEKLLADWRVAPVVPAAPAVPRPNVSTEPKRLGGDKELPIFRPAGAGTNSNEPTFGLKGELDGKGANLLQVKQESPVESVPSPK